MKALATNLTGVPGNLALGRGIFFFFGGLHYFLLQLVATNRNAV
jgi:hypothetical protein